MHMGPQVGQACGECLPCPAPPATHLASTSEIKSKPVNWMTQAIGLQKETTNDGKLFHDVVRKHHCIL